MADAEKSKSQQKREAKAAEAAKKAAEKAAAGKAALNEYRTNRLKEVEDMGLDVAYPHKWPVDISLPEFRTRFESADFTATDGHDSATTVHIAGRAMVIRSGKETSFIDLHADEAKVQIAVRGDMWKEDAAAGIPTYDAFMKACGRGDILGFRGHPGRSKTGELSLFATGGRLLSACYHMLPKGSALEDEETRKRQRYLDLICNPGVRRGFYVRNLVIRHIRDFLDSHGFMEVETPILNVVAGGATARPFITFHNEFKMQMFLRIATELPLKQLIVGGLDRVYEIGRIFRNEGVDQTHNPEFTSCEFYWAYKDYVDLMTFTEDMMRELVRKRNTDERCVKRDDPHWGTLLVEWRGTVLDFAKPFPRLPLIATIEEKTGKIPRPLDGPDAHAFLLKTCTERKLELEPPHTTKRLIDRLAEEYVESQCTQPTFVIDHPVLMTPLAKWNRHDAELTERFELFVGTKELANAYTELNSPQVQRERFAQQARDAAGDAEIPETDEAFCKSLEYALPPTAGWGLGIDRLAMFMSGSEKISEVILFPTVKPYTAGPAVSAAGIAAAGGAAAPAGAPGAAGGAAGEKGPLKGKAGIPADKPPSLHDEDSDHQA